MIPDDVRKEILDYIKSIDRSHPMEYDPGDEDDYGMDVRLQWHNESWAIHTGDSSYDCDHRGHWGSTSIPWEESDHTFDPAEVAAELIAQVEDSIAMSGEDE